MGRLPAGRRSGPAGAAAVREEPALQPQAPARAARRTIGPSRRVNYREIVRRVHWRRVDSAFEADWLYFEAARVLFPQTYQGMVGFRPAWFVHVNPEATFPRYTKTIDLGASRPARSSARSRTSTRPASSCSSSRTRSTCAATTTSSSSRRARRRARTRRWASARRRATGRSRWSRTASSCSGALRTLVDPRRVRPRAGAPHAGRRGGAAVRDGGEDQGVRRAAPQLGKGAVPARPAAARISRSSRSSAARGGTAKVFLVTPGGSKRSSG